MASYDGPPRLRRWIHNHVRLHTLKILDSAGGTNGTGGRSGGAKPPLGWGTAALRVSRAGGHGSMGGSACRTSQPQYMYRTDALIRLFIIDSMVTSRLFYHVFY